jgi:hypothetical protein
MVVNFSVVPFMMSSLPPLPVPAYYLIIVLTQTTLSPSLMGAIAGWVATANSILLEVASPTRVFVSSSPRPDVAQRDDLPSNPITAATRDAARHACSAKWHKTPRLRCYYGCSACYAV